MHRIFITQSLLGSSFAIPLVCVVLFSSFLLGCRTKNVDLEKFGPYFERPSDLFPPEQNPPDIKEDKSSTNEKKTEDLSNNAVAASKDDVSNNPDFSDSELTTDLPQNPNLNSEPILKTGYFISVSVRVGDVEEVKEPKLQISDKEEISLPLIGKVSCSGLTLATLHSTLARLYEEYFRGPDISVAFVYEDSDLSPYGQVYVQGQVVREGWINIPATRVLKVSRAIQLSGGFKPSARKNSVFVMRKDANGVIQRKRVDIEAIGKEGDLDKDISLEPNDVVYIKESFL